MNTEQTLKAVIDKYKLSDPVPENVRRAMEKSRRESLVRILKKDSHSALFITAVVSFFLWIRKFGTSISIGKSAVAVSAALIIGAGAVTAAGVYTVKRISDYLDAANPHAENTMNINNESDEHKKPVVSSVLSAVSYDLAVSPVEMDEVPDQILMKYREKFLLKLRSIRGVKAAVNIEKIDRYNTTDKILSITILKLKEPSGKSADDYPYRISVKIINAENSQVMLYLSETAENERSIPDSLSKLAENVSARL